MNVALWAEIRRLAEIEKLSARVISRRLHCSWRTVAQALRWEQPPAGSIAHNFAMLAEGAPQLKVACPASIAEGADARLQDPRQCLLAHAE